MGWTIKEIKTRARAAQLNSYWQAAGVIFIVSVITYVFNRLSSLLQPLFLQIGLGGSNTKTLIQELNSFAGKTDNVSPGQALLLLKNVIVEVLPTLLISGLIVQLIMVVYGIFLKPFLDLGACRWFSRNREMDYPAPYSFLFSLFKSKTYPTALKSTFGKNLRLYAWALPLLGTYAYMLYDMYSRKTVLLKAFDEAIAANTFTIDLFKVMESAMRSLAVSGFALMAFAVLLLYKQYEFYLADWFLSDNPALGGGRAVALSRELMKGQKGKLLGLNLSFIGWYILCALSIVLYPLLVSLVEAKRWQCMAEFFAIHRDKAVEKGLVTMEELGYRAVKAPEPEPLVFE